MRLRISARKSDLARYQAYRVGQAIKNQFPSFDIEFQFKESLGDKNLTDPLWKIPEKGVFTEDFYHDLTQGQTDMVVHSWKDLPTELKHDTEIAATLPRADQRDLLLVKKRSLSSKKISLMKIFSSSPRRAYNLKDFLVKALPLEVENIEFNSVRGNIPTRIRKLVQGQDADGLIVAKAALDRLLSAPESEFAEVQNEIRQHLNQLEFMVLPLSFNPNAAAQGALAIEILNSRQDLKEILQKINHAQTFDSVLCERKVLSGHGGGCHQKIGVAVLDREFGQVQICKGLTEAGVILDQHEVLQDIKIKFAADELVKVSSDLFNRSSINPISIPKDINALFVAKSSAWPSGLKFSGAVCVSGTNTWFELAKQGVWVHGSADGLGESEDLMLDFLVPFGLTWGKLTHSDGVQSGKYRNIATYSLVSSGIETKLTATWQGKKCFFWTSSSLFKRALELDPGLVRFTHCSGPGHSRKIINEILQSHGNTEKVLVFLSEKEWRQKMTKTF